MQDAVRLSEQAVRAMYERGYRTWLNIRDLASDNDQRIRDCLSSMQTAFPKHPQFPKDIKIDQVFTNVAIIRGRSTWAATTDTNHVPSFDQDTIFQVAWDKPTQINATPKPKNLKATRDSGTPSNTGNSSTEVDIGEVEDDGAQWWGAVLSNDGSWDLTIQGPNGKPLYSPWSIRPVLNGSFTIAKKITARSRGAVRTPTSSAAARGYLSDFCSLHEIEDQKLVALVDALLIPVAKYDGPFALLNQFNDDNALSRTLIRRDPDIGALWVGAFMTDAHHQCLQRAQAAWWDIDRKVAAWTDTPMSFIQEPISAFSGLKLKFLVQTNAGYYT
ncbi:hypothetical protein FOXYS1_8243 [Fusarium oxysporum]|uniref:Uncharacterized protein n=1 Tax=Fusarium oxysporum TaxID=5507 RepID=A0A8H5A9I0_FUSOX|nr:hypothetical protein FOXYS1_8243 [Fusarium oxysporum]